MKRATTGFLFLFIAAVLTVCYSPREFKSLAAGLSAEYRVYTTEECGGVPVFGAAGETVYITANPAVKTIGEELTFAGGDDDKEWILLRFFVTRYKVQRLSGVTVITGHSARLAGGGDNIQIAFDGETFKVGTPLLLGAY